MRRVPDPWKRHLPPQKIPWLLSPPPSLLKSQPLQISKLLPVLKLPQLLTLQLPLKINRLLKIIFVKFYFLTTPSYHNLPLTQIIKPPSLQLPPFSFPRNLTTTLPHSSLSANPKDPHPLNTNRPSKDLQVTLPPSITLFNLFSLLDTTLNKATKYTESSDPFNHSKFFFSAFSPSPPKIPVSLPPPPVTLTADEPLIPLEEASLQSL
ncbi:unnamed protein product [Brassica oleracea]